VVSAYRILGSEQASLRTGTVILRETSRLGTNFNQNSGDLPTHFPLLWRMVAQIVLKEISTKMQ
jgi:hypothetical protein